MATNHEHGITFLKACGLLGKMSMCPMSGAEKAFSAQISNNWHGKCDCKVTVSEIR